MIKALNDSVDLGAKVWFENTEPTHLSWSVPQRSLDVTTGHVTIVQSPRYLRLVKDDELPLWIWCAFRTRPGTEGLLLNMDPPRFFKLQDVKEPKHIDIDIQFVPVDKKPRKYQLNVKSWDELGLTEVR